MVNGTYNRPRRNKANSSIADCGFGIADSERPATRGRGRLYKQTQFAGINHATSPRCPASGNKANSRLRRVGRSQRGVGRWGERAKKSQSRPAGPGDPPSPLPGRLCPTNTNLGNLGYLGEMTAGTNEGQMRQTNPIWATARRRAKTWQERSYDQSGLQRALEKQSQFPATPGGTGPQGRGTRGQMCKTNPIPRLRLSDHVIASEARQCGLRIGHRPGAGRPLWAAGPEASCTSKPNLRRPGGRDTPSFHYSSVPTFQSDAYRAKQTQFRRREKQRQVLGGKGVMVNSTFGRPRQNKANSRLRREGRGHRDVGRGATAQNEANLAQRGRATIPRPSPLRPRPRQADRAKQSQFPIFRATRWARRPLPYARHAPPTEKPD
jgi:hypothetical protein